MSFVLSILILFITSILLSIKNLSNCPFTRKIFCPYLTVEFDFGVFCRSFSCIRGLEVAQHSQIASIYFFQIRKSSKRHTVLKSIVLMRLLFFNDLLLRVVLKWVNKIKYGILLGWIELVDGIDLIKMKVFLITAIRALVSLFGVRMLKDF
jgi:hypothetical protein